MPRHVVTRALGMEETVRVSVRTHRVLPEDLFLLCSDGLSDTLGDGRIEEVLGDDRLPEQHVRALVRAALDAGAHDNVAAVVVLCDETEDAPKRKPSVRPEPIVDLPPKVRQPVGSAPEIIIVGVESRVVPSESASDSLLDPLGRFARLRQPSVPEVAYPKPSRCGECGQPLENSTSICPTCGAIVRG